MLLLENGNRSLHTRPLRVLLERMEEHCPRALGELQRVGRKTTHWAWWVFPTEKEGASEPLPKTAVTPESAPALVAQARARDGASSSLRTSRRARASSSSSSQRARARAPRPRARRRRARGARRSTR